LGEERAIRRNSVFDAVSEEEQHPYSDLGHIFSAQRFAQKGVGLVGVREMVVPEIGLRKELEFPTGV
jgi:hypothetical protein